jgi:hypothetical protein
MSESMWERLSRMIVSFAASTCAAVIGAVRSRTSQVTIWSAIAFVSQGCPRASSQMRFLAAGSNTWPV